MGGTATNTPVDQGLGDSQDDDLLLDALKGDDYEEEEEQDPGEFSDEEDDQDQDADGESEGTDSDLPNTEEQSKGYLRHSDYTQKTQQLAEEKRALDAEKAQIAQLRQQYLESLTNLGDAGSQELSKFKNVNWAELKQTDPDEYVLKRAEYQEAQERVAELNKQRGKALEEQQQQYQVVFQQMAQQENLKLSGPDGIEGWADPVKGVEIRKAMRDYALASGYQEQEIQTLIDHRALKILDKARRYDALVAKSKDIVGKKRAKPVPKVVRPGSKTAGKSQSNAANRLRKTGRVEDAAAVFFEMLDDDKL